MSDDKVEFCPWCGGDVSHTLEHQGHDAFRAMKCDGCETVFRVEVPHRETEIRWTDAR